MKVGRSAPTHTHTRTHARTQNLVTHSSERLPCISERVASGTKLLVRFLLAQQSKRNGPL